MESLVSRYVQGAGTPYVPRVSYRFLARSRASFSFAFKASLRAFSRSFNFFL